MSEVKLPAIISDTVPEFDTTAEDDLMKSLREECARAEDEIIVANLAEIYRATKAKPKTVHAIAHFDFDGSCAGCPLWVGWAKIACGISKTQFDVTMVPEGRRHEHCPLCIEEDGDD